MTRHKTKGVETFLRVMFWLIVIGGATTVMAFVGLVGLIVRTFLS